MKRQSHFTTRAGIERLKPPASGQKEYSDGDTPGLFVRVSAGRTRSFVTYYRIGGKNRRYTIGEFNQKARDGEPGSLGWARDETRKIRQLAKDGMDPREERRAAIEQAGRKLGDTYATAVREYVDERQRKERGNATANEIERVLLKEGAGWQRRPVSAITPRDVRSLLTSIRDGKNDATARPYLANRTYAYLRTFFAWCAEPGIEKIERSPMEGLKRPWNGEEVRDRHYSDEELRALWQTADKIGGYRGGFLKLLLLTGKRKGALAAMRWDEVDLEAGVWQPADAVPPMARKGKQANKRVHAVPLSRLAVRVISALPRVEGNPYVFVGRRTGLPLDPGTPFQKQVIAVSGVDGFRFHDVRHSVETGLSKLEVLPFMRDMLLDHAPHRGAGAGYDHNLYVDAMRQPVELWANHIAKLGGGENISLLR